MRKRSFRFAVIAIGLAVTLAGSAAAQTQPPTTQVPQPPANNVNWPGAGYGVGSLLCNVLYIPAKLIYAVLGGVVGGGTYLVTGGNQTGGQHGVAQLARRRLRSDAANARGPAADQFQRANQYAAQRTGIGQQPPARHGSDHDGKLGRYRADNAATAVGIGLVRDASSAGGQPLDHGSGPATSGSNIE